MKKKIRQILINTELLTFQYGTATIVMFYCLINTLSLSLSLSLSLDILDQSMTTSIPVSIGRLMLMLTPLDELVAFLMMVT